jgi:hypothetical protein
MKSNSLARILLVVGKAESPEATKRGLYTCAGLLWLRTHHGRSQRRFEMKSSNIWVAMLVVCFLLAPVVSAQQEAGLPIQTNSAAAPSVSTALVPQLIKFNGTLLDADERPTTGMTGVTFALYSEQTGGASLWMETQNVKPDANGNYTVLLGAASKGGVPAELFATGEARWLGIQVEQRPELARVVLVSVPYALKAADATTLGGLPASAFALAGSNPSPSGEPSLVLPSVAGAQSTAPLAAGTSDVTTTGGTVNTFTLFTAATNIQNSILTQTSTTAINVLGKLNFPALGTATASAGFKSWPQDFVASVFDSSTAKAVPQTFQWQAEALNNDKSTATGTLNLLYASGTATPAETGLHIASNGLITFASGQTLPSVSGNETVTGDLTASELISTVATGTAPLKVTSTTEVANLNASLLGGKAASAFAQLAAANTFTGNQTVNGNLSAIGTVSGSSFEIGSNLFAFGSSVNVNAFLGFAGNTTMTGTGNTASGPSALYFNTSGGGNTASGAVALFDNSTGNYNTANGNSALFDNTTGSGNTASGDGALVSNRTGNYNTASGDGAGGTADASLVTGSNNTFLGVTSAMSTGSLSNATAIGANALVAASNALVLGSINGVNGATANTNVGIGTTAPAATLHLDLLDRNNGAFDYLLIGNTSSKGLEFFDSGAGVDIRSFGVPLYINYAGQNTLLNYTGGRVGIGDVGTPTNLLTLQNGGGPAIADGWNTYSSRRWKTNIHPVENALSKVEQLRGVSYDLKGSGKHEIGVIAEEVGQVVPEVVSYEQNGKDAAGVDYSRLTALLIEAVKQQQREIRDLKSELRTTRQTLQKVQAQVAGTQPTLVAAK